MSKCTKIMGMALAAMLFVAAAKVNVYADGITMSADKDSYEVGETVSVTVDVENAADAATPPQVNVEYNPSRLEFLNCSTEYGGGGGGLVTLSDTNATIEFNTLSGGNANINVTATVGDESNVLTSDIVINVNGEDTVGEDTELSETSTGVEAGTIGTSDGREVQMVFADEFMPVLFHKATTTYQGQTIECAKFDMSDMELLYTTDASGADGRFCTYNAATGELSDFRMIQGIENRFIIVLNEEVTDVPSGYTKAVLDWNGQTLTAYMNNEVLNGGATDFAGASLSDFFLVYALSSEGTKGWYQYDQKEGTYQRFVMVQGTEGTQSTSFSKPSSVGSEEETFLDDMIPRNIQAILLVVFVCLFLVLLVVVIILAVKCSEYNDYEYMDPEEYYEQIEPAQVSRSTGSITAAEIVNKTMADDGDVKAYEKEDEPKRVMPKKKIVKAEDIEDLSDGKVDDTEAIEESNEKDEASNESESYKIAEEHKLRGDVTFKQAQVSDKYLTKNNMLEDDDIEAVDDIDDYFEARMSRKEAKELAKQRKREAKEAAREEKWRLKEEKRAAKMRSKGYEEAEPMDWSSFSESMSQEEDDRRPMGKGSLPSYMQDKNNNESEEAYVGEEIKTDVNKVEEDEGIEETIRKTPPRKQVAPISAQKEEEYAQAKKEDELRKKQKRLFEQQQRIEEQRRIEQEQYEEQQRLEQERYVLSQKIEEDLDEDFQFEFLNL